MIYLTLPELLRVAEWVLGPDGRCGISACWRRRSPAHGPRPSGPTRTDLDESSGLAAFLTRNHALIDGNKRLALSGLIVSTASTVTVGPDADGLIRHGGCLRGTQHRR
jgi:death-on-curing protein